MQQLQVKLKNVPVDASQVHCSTSSALNKEEIPSVQDKVLTCNNLVGHHPLVVQMLVPTGSNKQKIELGIDSGYKWVGFSCVSRVAELVSGELELDKKTKKRLAEREMYRRGRRNKL